MVSCDDAGFMEQGRAVARVASIVAEGKPGAAIERLRLRRESERLRICREIHDELSGFVPFADPRTQHVGLSTSVLMRALIEADQAEAAGCAVKVLPACANRRFCSCSTGRATVASATGSVRDLPARNATHPAMRPRQTSNESNRVEREMCVACPDLL